MLKILNNVFEKEANKKLGNMQLTRSQISVLIYIYKNKEKEIYQKDIEINFKLKNPTVTGLLTRLENKGFVSRIKGKDDARYKRIVLTEKSIKFAEDMKNSSKEILNKLTRNISEDELNLMEKILEKMLSNLLEEDN